MYARAIAAALILWLAQAGGADDRVTIRVDADARLGPLTPIWAMFGYDEPNYTYTANGKKLLGELAALSPVPVFVRAHNMLTSGDGTAALKWCSPRSSAGGVFLSLPRDRDPDLVRLRGDVLRHVDGM